MLPPWTNCLQHTAATSGAERNAFRVQWASRQLATLTTGKTHEKCWQRVHTTKGRYLSLGALAAHYGFQARPKEAMDAAVRYANKCVSMLGQWVRWCGMSEQCLFLLIDMEHEETVKEAWTLFEREHDSGASGSASGSGSGEPNGNPPQKDPQ